MAAFTQKHGQKEKTVAIMQPYFLPYIGYFQLIAGVDKFVLYDDVSFINRGWINRNNLLAGGKASMFTIPLEDASQNRLIRDIRVVEGDSWRKKFLKTVQQSYGKAPFFGQIYPLVEEIIRYEPASIADLCHFSIARITGYLGIGTELAPTSSVYGNNPLKAAERILDICLREEAGRYINPPGGMSLYNRETFAEAGVELCFLKSDLLPYPQFRNEFVPGLSILDVLMFNDKAAVHELLGAYQLV